MKDALFLALLLAVPLIRGWDRFIGNAEAFLFRLGGIVEGYKTQLMTAVTAILSGAAAFGFDLTPEQRAAVLSITSVVVWPAVMLIMRAVTKGPMRNPVTGRHVGSSMRSPWWVCLLALLLLLGGCTSDGQLSPGAEEVIDSDVVQTVLASDLPETMIIVGTMKAIESSDDRPAKAARYRETIRRFEAAVSGESVRAGVLEGLVRTLLEGQVTEPSDRILLQRAARIPAELAGPDQFIVGENLTRLRTLLSDLEQVTYLYE